MDIESFLEYMIKECKWIEGAPPRVNKTRFQASDFDTPEFECEWDVKGVCHMLEMCSNYPRFALMTLRKPRNECTSDEVATGMVTSDGEHVDSVIAILAMQGHTRVKAHPHMFGWHRLDWREAPILFHQTDPSNHDSIMKFGLRPGGLDKRGNKRWCVYASLADGHKRVPNITMIDGKLAQPYKFRDDGIVYCISTRHLTVVMGVEVWRTEAWCAMILGNVPIEAIPYSFQCNSGEMWHQDKNRHQHLMDRCRDCFIENQQADED